MDPKKILFTFFIISILIIFSLEILSKIYQNKCRHPYFSSPCLELREESQSLISPDESFLLANLKNKRESGEKTSKEEYRSAADKLILEVSSELLPGRNGQSCSNFGFVRNDLPVQAKKFVKRHELEHLLQTGKERNREFSANLAAGKEYPLGLIQTIFFSLKSRAKYYDSPLCYILTSWKTFKIYFLP